MQSICCYFFLHLYTHIIPHGILIFIWNIIFPNILQMINVLFKIIFYNLLPFHPFFPIYFSHFIITFKNIIHIFCNLYTKQQYIPNTHPMFVYMHTESLFDILNILEKVRNLLWRTTTNGLEWEVYHFNKIKNIFIIQEWNGKSTLPRWEGTLILLFLLLHFSTSLWYCCTDEGLYIPSI